MRGFGLSCLLTLLLFAPAEGTSLRKITFDEAVKGAGLVFIGTVEEATPRLVGADEDEAVRRLPIWTDYRFGRITAIKGTADASLTIRLAGGRVGDRVLAIPEMPKFETGERYLLMLTPERKGLCPIVGWKQGMFRIVRDPDTGADLVQDGFGRMIREIRGGLLRPVDTESPDEESVRLTLGEFVQDIRARINRHSAEEREEEQR